MYIREGANKVITTGGYRYKVGVASGRRDTESSLFSRFPIVDTSIATGLLNLFLNLYSRCSRPS